MRRAAVVALVAGALACSSKSTTPADGGAQAFDAGAADPGAIARAEDQRRAKDVPPVARTSHDVASRRRSARALARIADAASLEGLTAALADEDLLTVAWAAYGLGYACKGHEEAHVKALAARAASLPVTAPAHDAKARGEAEIEPWTAIARAIGRCGAPTSERVLLSLSKSGAGWAHPALLGLGDLATRRKQLGAEAMTSLLETKDDDAFYPLSRAEQGEAFGGRVADDAIAALARPGEARIFAVKTLGRASKEKAPDAARELARVVADAKGYTTAERAEAARGLKGLGPPGLAAAADALGKLEPTDFNVLYTLIDALGAEPPKPAEKALFALAGTAVPPDASPGVARRYAELRCAAALALSRGAHDAGVIMNCAPAGSEPRERARLTALVRRPLDGERRKLFVTFTKSEQLRIREQAVEAVTEHPELRDAAAPILAEALTSHKAGLVATAAEVVHTHPERALVLAESEKRAALDPRAPPPSADPKQELSKDVSKALAAALAETWPEDRFETRIALIEAAAAVHLPQAKAAAQAGCNDPNVVVRDRSQKALRAMGESVGSCAAPDKPIAGAPELGKEVTKPQHVVFTTDAGAELSVFLEPELSPITATRIAALVNTGFFKGIVIHRVVPGFVAQLGDPEGDGYGGSGTSLRCETSPVPFAPLDVGMALAGRDTGSSQIFVTLSRTPHLDGEYTRVGRAEGPWETVIQGDVIADAKLVP